MTVDISDAMLRMFTKRPLSSLSIEKKTFTIIIGILYILQSTGTTQSPSYASHKNIKLICYQF
jgi:hypothetical protein